LRDDDDDAASPYDLQKDVIFFSFFKNMFFGAVLLLD
jgi:hypothetical protein